MVERRLREFWEKAVITLGGQLEKRWEDFWRKLSLREARQRAKRMGWKKAGEEI